MKHSLRYRLAGSDHGPAHRALSDLDFHPFGNRSDDDQTLSGQFFGSAWTRSIVL